MRAALRRALVQAPQAGVMRVRWPAARLIGSISPAARGICSRAADASAYDVLGLPRDASAQQVKLTYYHLAMEYHPDRAEGAEAKANAAERFARIGAAYDAIMGEPDQPHWKPSQSFEVDHLAPPAEGGYPSWAYRIFAHLNRIPARLDRWLMPSYSSVIYGHLRKGELSHALAAFEEMRLEASALPSPPSTRHRPSTPFPRRSNLNTALSSPLRAHEAPRPAPQGERPSHAVYEMLMRGCTIAMRRVGPREEPDHLSVNLVKRASATSIPPSPPSLSSSHARPRPRPRLCRRRVRRP